MRGIEKVDGEGEEGMRRENKKRKWEVGMNRGNENGEWEGEGERGEEREKGRWIPYDIVYVFRVLYVVRTKQHFLC